MELPAGVREVSFAVSEAPDEEFATFGEVTARVAGPRDVVEVPCFWDGTGAWRARFRTPGAGTYQVTVNGLATSESAMVEVDDTSGADMAPLLRRRDRRLVTADGRPFLWLADTWWYALCDRVEFPTPFEDLLSTRRSQGFTVIQLVAGLLPEVEAFDPLGNLAERWPWTEEFAAIEPRWWDAADERVAAVVAAGLVPAVAGAWSYYLLDMGPRRIEAHWRQIIARWGAFPVVWCVAGEAGLPHYADARGDDLQARVSKLSEQWRGIARKVREIDGYANLTTVHPWPMFGTFSSTDAFGDVSDLDLIWLQTGHDDRVVIEQSLSAMEKELAAPHGLPVVNSEVCYEGIAAGSPATLQRFLFWSNLLSGAAGHSYGAQGLWAFRREQDPGPGFRWGGATWQEAFELPGAAHVGSSAELLRSLTWEALSPAPSTVSPAAPSDRRIVRYAAAADGLRVVYFPAASLLPSGLGSGHDQGRLWLEDLGDSEWLVTLWSPGRSRTVEELVARPDAAGRWLVGDGRPNSLPSLDDWVLIARRRPSP